MSQDELSLTMRRMAHVPRRKGLRLPELKDPSDAVAAMAIVNKAFAEGRVSLAQARELRSQVRVFIQACQAEVVDYKRDWQAREAELKRRLSR